jgi:hypothetical protein
VKLSGDAVLDPRPSSECSARPRARSKHAPGRSTLAPTVKELQTAGCRSLRAIVAALGERGIPAAQGGQRSATQVMRLLEHIGPFDADTANASAAAA